MLNEKIQQETPTNFIPGTTKTQNQLNQNPNPNQAQDCPTNIPLEENTRYEHAFTKCNLYNTKYSDIRFEKSAK